MALQPVLSFPLSFPDKSVNRLAQGSVRLPNCITMAWAAGTAPCDIKLTGVDSQLANLTGGMDGLYKLWSCEGGRPLYKREEPGAWLYLHVCLYVAMYMAFLHPQSTSHLSMGTWGDPRRRQSRPVVCLVPSSAFILPQPTQIPAMTITAHCHFCTGNEVLDLL